MHILEFVKLYYLFVVVCFQDQHMKHSLKSYIKLLKTINASANQSCPVLASPFAIMLVMYVKYILV